MQWDVLLTTIKEADVAFVTLILATVILLALVIRLEIKLKRFLIDKKAVGIGDSIEILNEAKKSNEQFQKEMEKYLTLLEERVKSGIRGVGIIRFNPFKGSGSGGNQSFAIAMLNEEGSGVIISSLYSREHMSVYSKPIAKFSSEFDLTLEERQAIKKARSELALRQPK